MHVLNGGLECVPGYRYSATCCGIKYENRLDFALIHSPLPCNAAGVFTTNRVFAAPVRWCRERIDRPVHGILINAGNANACTGDEGYAAAANLANRTALALGAPAGSVLMASTGVIGVRLPEEKMLEALPELTAEMSPENGKLIPRAIMTTDTFPKAHALSFKTPAGDYSLAGTAKGAGMIAPNMATLLAFMVTDIPLERELMQSILKRCVDRTLNAVTIDGDMSTNDTALLLCPRGENPVSDRESAAAFEEALFALLGKLGELIVRDGEGATKFITVRAVGAATEDDAMKVSRAVAESLLVKTAMFGNDPNWGRIACAAGYSGAPVEEKLLSISIGGAPLLVMGVPAPLDREKIRAVIGQKDVEITVDLGMGDESFTCFTSDISYDYVKINAEYTT